VRLSRQLVTAQLKQRYYLPGQALCSSVALRIQHYLCYQVAIRFNHGHLAEQLLKILRQVRAASIAWVHSYEDAHDRIKAYLAIQQVDLVLAFT